MNDQQSNEEKCPKISDNPFESPQKTTFQWSWTNRGWLVYEGENQEWKPQNPGTNPARLKIRSKDSSHIRIEQNIYFYAPGKGSSNLLVIIEDRNGRNYQNGWN